MGIYNTYKEAVLANGSTKGVMFARNCLTGEEFFQSRIDFDYELQCPNLDGALWVECNPANYLETLESFLASGRRLKYGDLYVELHGVVAKVLSETDANTKSSRDHKRYILQAAADEHNDPIKEKQKIYKTYKEAVIANGSVKGIHCAIISNDGKDGVFGLEKDVSIVTANTLPCHPSGCLQTLADFLESGMSLTKGDLLINTMGQVCSVNHPSAMGMPVEMNKNRYVLDAMAYKSFDELARELDNEINQAFEMGVDTTPQQVESLASRSEKPNSSEWQNGDECVWGSGLPAKIVGPMPSHPSRVVVEVKDALGAHVKVARINDLQKPETPSEREKRKQLEAAKDLWEKIKPCADGEWEDMDEVIKDLIVRAVGVTGYRKD